MRLHRPRAAGISEASVRRIWRSHGLKPHRVESFKVSNDPQFAEKLEDIAGLYLNLPEHALVLCVDEKSQIQALDRTQPGFPLKRGRSQTMTHDYKRNGTATLFAALNAANGEVYGLCQERHRHQEWLKFLRLLDQTMPVHLDLHLIADNYATHKHPKVQLFSFRMISDTRIECCNANSRRETAWFRPIGPDWGGVKPGSSGATGLDGFLSSLPQRGPYLPRLRHQPSDVLSLATPL